MNSTTRTYSILAVIFSGSLLAAWLVSASPFVQGMMILPGVGALLAALLQLARDTAGFERQKHLQLDEQIFALGASSHMSTVAFDKHVEFCESYMSEVHETVGILFREGPSNEAMNCAQRLFELKRKFAAWIPKSVAAKLEPFENAVHKIGVNAHLSEALRGQKDETRTKAIDEAYSLFSDVMGLKELEGDEPEHRKQIAIENVKEEVRSVLGINELFEIRNFIIERSVEFTRGRA